jgi:hypothetical protein
MASAVDLVLSRVNENLEYAYKKDHADNFFQTGISPFMSMLEEKAVEDSGSRSFSTQMITRGTVGPNPRWVKAGVGVPGRHEVLFPAVNIEWRATWTRDEMLAAARKGSTNAFELAKQRIDQEMHFTRHTLEKLCGGRGSGALAGIVAVTTGAGGTVTIGLPDQNASGDTMAALVNRFAEGFTYQAADAEFTGNMRGSDPGDTAVLQSKNPSTGVLTFDTVPTSWLDGDILFEDGYRNYAASDGALCVRGLYAWCDYVAASSGESFGGIDRSTAARAGLQPHRLALDTLLPLTTIKEKLLRMDEYAYTMGLKGSEEETVIMIHPQEFRRLTADVEVTAMNREKIQRTNSKGESYTIGLPSFNLTGHRGNLPIVPDPFAIFPTHAVWGPFKSKEMGFKLQYAGDEIINTNRSDGKTFRMETKGVNDALGNVVDGFSAAGFFRGQISCAHPGNYLVGTELTDTAV